MDFEKPEQIGSLAKQLLDTMKEPVSINNHQVHIGASIGIAIYPEDGESVGELTKHADTAMYQAKDSGKNTFRFFHQQMNFKANYRLGLIHDLHKAVHESVFELYYQPKYQLESQTLVGMEALIRWPKSDGEMISPLEFIPCAEETGLIETIGKWVLEEACSRTKYWNQRFNGQLQVAVNLSARQFQGVDLVKLVTQTLEETGLEKPFLELEITESMLMGDVEKGIALMTRLHELGISIAIDDFGTGYSSLNYLKQFPINTLKIDKSFVQELEPGSKDDAIIRSIISLADTLGFKVVAEGVEYAEQLELLKAYQCELGQGYFLGKPMPADQFEAFLAKDSKRL